MRSSPSDLDYYRRRERECRAHAEQASDPHIRNLHLDFARRYALATADAPAPDAPPYLNGVERMQQRA